MNSFQILFLITILLVCGITDILKGKIYNFLTFPGIIIGLASQWYYYGIKGLFTSFLGLAISTVFFIIIYIWGGIGAGDVKLMMVIGATVGYYLVFDFILYSAIAGGIMAHIVIIKNKRFIQTWRNILRFFFFLIPGYHLKSEPLRKENSLNIPYGYAISIGSLVYLFIIL